MKKPTETAAFPPLVPNLIITPDEPPAPTAGDIPQICERSFRVLSEVTPVPIFVTRIEDGKVIFVNAAAASLFDVPPDRILGLSTPAFYRNRGDRRRLVETIRRAGRISDQPIEFRTPGGGSRHFLITCHPVQFCGIAALAAFANDITQRVEAERATQRLQAELTHVARMSATGQMAAGFAHELNQPLTAISNYAIGAVRRSHSGGIDEKNSVRVLELIADQARRASEIIRRIRNFLAKRDIARTPLDINHTIRETVALLQGEVLKHDATIDLDLDDSLPPVRGDGVQLQQAVFNLARNGLEAMSEASRVPRTLAIRTRRDGAHGIEVVIADSGPGIEPTIRARLFEPFFTTKAAGLGLGLSICRSIVEAHGGTLAIDERSGGGTSIRFTVPAVENSGA